MSVKTTPRVGIGLPVFNGERFLAECIDSILRQSFSNFEVIISDNASTDSTPKICREYAARDNRIRYYRNDENLGAARNFNKAFRLSQGVYFKWAAHDDLLDPTFLEKCISALDRDPTLVLAYTRAIFIDESGKYQREFETGDLSRANRRQRFLYCASMEMGYEVCGVIRSDVLRKTPLIASYMGSDLVLVGELALHGGFYQVPEPLFLHREHQGRSAMLAKNAKSFVRAYTKWFDTSKSGRFALPHWRRLLGNAGSIYRHPLPWIEKMALLVDLCRAANWKRRSLADDIWRLLREASDRP